MTNTDRFVAEGIRAARRIVIAVAGLTVMIAGIVLLVLPGPAFLVIPIGLGILAIEFEWARRLLRRARRIYDAAAQNSRPVESDQDGVTASDPDPETSPTSPTTTNQP
jgi:uncharacterized protein (TIGR02611 family)